MGLLLQGGEVEKFPQARSLDSLLRVSKGQGPCPTTIEDDGDNKKLAQLDLVFEDKVYQKQGKPGGETVPKIR